MQSWPLIDAGYDCRASQEILNSLLDQIAFRLGCRKRIEILLYRDFIEGRVAGSRSEVE